MILMPWRKASAAALVVVAAGLLAAAAASPSAPTYDPGAGPAYTIDFSSESVKLSSASKKTIAQAAEAAAAFAMESLEIKGYASRSEHAPAAKAQKRAEAVAAELVNRWKVDPARLLIRRQVVPGDTHEVRIRFVVPRQNH